MGKIKLFKPKANATAKENLRDFVELGKSLAALDAKDQFENDVWEVERFFGKTKRLCIQEKDGSPFWGPLRSFFKSYLAYQRSFEPHRGSGVLEDAIYSIRPLNAVCKIIPGLMFEDLSGEHFGMAVEQMKKSELNISTQYRQGICLEKIAMFMSEHMLVVGPLMWSSPIKLPANLATSSRAGGDEARAKKLPAQGAMEAIANIFFLSHKKGCSDYVAQVVSSYCVLLMSNPSRAREVLDLPLDILVENFSESNGGLGLRWWPEKGGSPIVKPVLGPMEDVVRKAHRSLVDNSENARNAARWYESNPNSMYLPPAFESYRQKEFLCRDEIIDVFFNGEPREYARMTIKSWLKTHKIPYKMEVVKEVSGHARQWVKFADLEASVLKCLPKDLLDRPRGRKYSELLFLTEGRALRGPYSDNGTFFSQISYESVANALGAVGSGDTGSIFEKYGCLNPDGSPIRINSHQFRHWLNTLAQLSGVAPVDIAMWSGRKSVAQNEVYNHITPEQRLARLRAQVGDKNKAVGALSGLPKVIPIKRAEYAAAKIPTAHVTDFGYCIHDFSFEPCQLHRDCLSCNDHVCVKGDEAAEARLSLKLDETARLLGKAQAALSEEEYGADRWVEHNKAVLARLVALKAVLTNPDIQKGAIIQLSNPTAPSRLKEALASRVQLALSKTKGVLINEKDNAIKVDVIKAERSRKGREGSQPG